MQYSKTTKYWNLIKNQFYGTDDFIINWDNFSKGVLVLILCAIIQIGSTIWYVICFYIPETHIWLNAEFFLPRVFCSSVCIAVNLLAIWSSFTFKKVKYFRKFIEFFAPNFFGITMVYSAYTIGVYNPATLAGLINILLLGLVFYERKILYTIAVPVIFYVAVMCYLSTVGYVRYAPVFTEQLNNSVLYKNWFWVFTMLQLYLPILLVSVFLFEVLLSQWRKRESKSIQLSKMDALTGVFNRRFIGDFIEGLKEHQYALILLDLDYFKKINDNYGHDVGDHVLCRVAKVLSANIRGSDIVGRFGGEEFMMVLQARSIQQAKVIAERCRRQIEMENFAVSDCLSLKISASFGITLSSSELTYEQVMKQADQALYMAKKKGRNQVQCFDVENQSS